MTDNKTFHNLFIFEMANNHMGDVEHGLRIIKEFHEARKGFDFNFAFKLQYRDLDTFIHPDFKGRKDIKYVKRFEETRLAEPHLKRLKDEMVRLGFVSICTPFDENSVDLIEKHGFDVIKIASCSFTDWPLLERIARTDKPIIASTAGASLEDIDKVVSFFEHRRKDLCVMHCVGEYPTGEGNLQLNQIDLLEGRYPEVSVGYSTHEHPENIDAVKIAVGKGATVFERHVGVKTERYDLNAYSSTPDQVRRWLLSAKEAFKMCGISNRRNEFSQKELADLKGLRRGVFVRASVRKGEEVSANNVFFAIPTAEAQILANDMSKYTKLTAKRDIVAKGAVMSEDVDVKNLRQKVLEIIKSMSKMLADSRIVLPQRLELELSHHYGIERFDEWGAAIINCINREYCKKLIILLPNQRHPAHYHKKKEETFHVLYGEMSLNLNGEEKKYKSGDLVVVERGMNHSFSSDTGAIFEEISTTHYKDDSYYEDAEILKNKSRKTEMTFWSDWLYRPIS